MSSHEAEIASTLPSLPVIHHVYLDRTSLLLYWDCPRMFYWGRRHRHSHDPNAPLGLEGSNDEAKLFGKIMHTAVELGFGDLLDAPGPTLGSAVMGQLLPLFKTLDPPIQKEYTGLLFGMCQVLTDQVRPYLLSQYEVVAIEVEMVWSLPPTGSTQLHVRVKPDLVLRHKVDGQIVYWEWKTTAFNNMDQMAHYQHNVQVQIGMQAVAQHYGTCDWAEVGLFYKGQRRYGVRTSPFCYGYQSNHSGALSTEYTKGWAKRPLVDILMERDWTMGHWVKQMPDEQLGKQFFSTGPIFPSALMIEGMRAQLPLLLDDLTAADVDDYAQHFNRCQQAGFGSGCQFFGICHEVPTGGLSTFQPRVPHHDPKPIRLWAKDQAAGVIHHVQALV